MDPNNELDPRLRNKLTGLQTVADRNPQKALQGRAKFMQSAQDWAESVTPSEKRRHNGWNFLSLFFIRRKEQNPMFSTLATILLVVSLVVGGGGATLVSAQSSQPDQPLYSVKLWSEDFRLGVTTNPQAQVELVLDFANRRVAEIQTALEAGDELSQEVQSRYQNEVEQAIRYALNLPDDQALLALAQIHTQLQLHEQDLAQVQMNGSPPAEAVLSQTRLMLQERLVWVADGLADPAQLRDQLRQRDQQSNPNLQNTATQTVQDTQTTSETGSGNPWVIGTPTPGSGYGPGSCVDCTPVGEGSNPWTTGTPTPGSGYGPGPGVDVTRTCTPGSQSGSGPQPTQAQNQPTTAGPQSTQPQSQPTAGGSQGQPTSAGPQPTASGSGPQPTPNPGSPGGRN